jgi:GTPase SAR1 family protein
MYYKNAAAVALVYDQTCDSSFSSIERWVEEIETNGAKNL